MEQGLNYCHRCEVYVDACFANCPLCGEHLTDHPSANQMYPPLKRRKFIDKRSMIGEQLAFFTFVIIAVCLVINLLTGIKPPWFMAAAAPLLYAWILVKLCVMSNFSFGFKVLMQIIGLSAMFLAFDFVSGWHGWSYEVIIPLILIVSIAVMDFYAVFHQSRWREVLLYAFLFLILGFIPLILYFLGVPVNFFLMIVSTAAGGVTILGIFLFAFRQLRSELLKKFYM